MTADGVTQVVRRSKSDPNAPKVMMGDKEAEQSIAEFMEKSNRPYSV